VRRFAILVALFLTSLSVSRPSAQPSNAPDVPIARLERRVFELINKERIDEKRSAMEWDERLTRIARAHSEDMVKRRFFEHINPDGADASARGKHAGYACLKRVDRRTYRQGLAENLFEEPRFSRVRITAGRRSYDWNSMEEIARQAVDGWMRSAGHRHNILEKTYEQSGVGIAVSLEHVYITQLFC
jgi:uncharacterized protein YkwD